MRRQHAPLPPPMFVTDDVSLGEGIVRYHGDRVRVATVLIRGEQVELGLAGTAQCAKSAEDAAAVLQGHAERLHVRSMDLDMVAKALHVGCAKLVRKENRL